MCEERDAAKVTTASCVTAYNAGGECTQICRFTNLYYGTFEPEDADQQSQVEDYGSPLVAHVINELDPSFPHERVSRIQDFHRPRVHIHEDVAAFRAHLAKVKERLHLHRPTQVISNLTTPLLFAYIGNVGHLLYDNLYPAFVSLQQFGIASKRFNILQYGLLDEEDAFIHTIPMLKTFGGGNHYFSDSRSGQICNIFAGNRTCPGSLSRFQDIVVGYGRTRDEYDMNANFSLAGGKGIFNSIREFRKEVYRRFDVPLPLMRKNSAEKRNNSLRGIIVQSESTYRIEKEEAQQTIDLAKSFGIELRYVAWTDPNTWFLGIEPGLKYNHEFSAVDRFRAHLQIIRDTDIHISGPGTTFMYQQFMPDGSVVINLGHLYRGYPFMDEFMAEGTSYLRAMYARLPGDYQTPSRPHHIALLAAKARQYILNNGGFRTDFAPAGINLSPITSLLKTYIHLVVPALPHLTPLRTMDEFRCIDFYNIDTFAMRPCPKEKIRTEICEEETCKEPCIESREEIRYGVDPTACKPRNPCLMAALAIDFERHLSCSDCEFVNLTAFGDANEASARVALENHKKLSNTGRLRQQQQQLQQQYYPYQCRNGSNVMLDIV